MKQEEVQLERLGEKLQLTHSYFWYLGHRQGERGNGPDLMPPNLSQERQLAWIEGYREGLKKRENEKNGVQAKMKHEIAVAAVLFDDRGSILLEHRAKEPGKDLYVLPGGMLDEPDPREGLAREVKEELGIEIHPGLFTPVYTAFDKKKDGEPLIMLYYAAKIRRGTERNMEPNKCYGLHWFNLYKLPSAQMWLNDRGAISYADSFFDFRKMGIAK
jgi:8-oxo-dGTP diphosphatase